MARKTPVPKPPPFDPEDPDTVEGEFKETAADPEPNATKEPEDVPEPAPIRALVTSAADHHLVVGMATLANMGEDEFRAKLDVMKRGHERIAIIQKELMKEGTDYGKVPGIAKPFLHQPGAEMLSNLYGLAVRQEAERIVRKVGDDPGIPPYAYHVKSFVHLGDTSGPIVAEGFGEANPYEEKYRYRFVNPGCPVCGKVGAILLRKSPPALAGKKQCASFGDKGGCGTVFEPNDPRLAPSTKEPTADTDLFGLAETIIQMAAKRSLVASIRRATGTSGLFTQDEDSPSVQKQSSESAEGQPSGIPDPVIESAQTAGTIEVGGKGSEATAIQHTQLKTLAMQKGLNGAKIADLLSRLFGMEVAPTGAAASAAVRTLNADQMGQLLQTIDTGELPDPTKAPTSPGPNTPTSATPQEATSTGADDDPEVVHGGMSDHAAH